MGPGNGTTLDAINTKPKMSVRLNQYFTRFYELFVNPRLRNSTISSCIVALGQQLCGSQSPYPPPSEFLLQLLTYEVNIFAFYSTSLFLKVLDPITYDGVEEANSEQWRDAMLYSFGFGMIFSAHFVSFHWLTVSGLANFLFGIPAVGTIDTFGRRKWLLVTIPGMAVALAAAAASLEHPDEYARRTLVLVFMLGMSAFEWLKVTSALDKLIVPPSSHRLLQPRHGTRAFYPRLRVVR